MGKKDYLTEDPPVEGQKVALVSFLAPEHDTLESKYLYFLHQFLYHEVNHERSSQVEQVVTEANAQMTKAMDKVKARLQNSEDPDDRRIAEAFEDMFKKKMKLNVDEIKNQMMRQWSEKQQELIDKYDQYVIDNNNRLLNEFRQMTNDKPDTRGFKIRGVYDNPENEYVKNQINRRKKELEGIEDCVHIWDVEVGKWCVFNPDPDMLVQGGQIAENYMGGEFSQLQQLKKDQMANREEAKIYHEKRRQIDKEASHQEQMKSGMKSLLQSKKKQLEKHRNKIKDAETEQEDDNKPANSNTERNRKKREAKKRRKQQQDNE